MAIWNIGDITIPDAAEADLIEGIRDAYGDPDSTPLTIPQCKEAIRQSVIDMLKRHYKRYVDKQSPPDLGAT